ncbi:MAG: antitoxin [Podoviridae sp. ctbd591]|nr:MAG: antitoxin [Podoviridae sp. ctbd591]
MKNITRTVIKYKYQFGKIGSDLKIEDVSILCSIYKLSDAKLNKYAKEYGLVYLNCSKEPVKCEMPLEDFVSLCEARENSNN